MHVPLFRLPRHIFLFCYVLGTGGTLPLIDYNNDLMVNALKEYNIRHIDSASLYRCEHQVAISIQESGVARQDLFLTTKLWPTQFGYDNLKKAVRKSLNNLDVDYIGNDKKKSKNKRTNKQTNKQTTTTTTKAPSKGFFQWNLAQSRRT